VEELKKKYPVKIDENVWRELVKNYDKWFMTEGPSNIDYRRREKKEPAHHPSTSSGWQNAGNHLKSIQVKHNKKGRENSRPFLCNGKVLLQVGELTTSLKIAGTLESFLSTPLLKFYVSRIQFCQPKANKKTCDS
jgi:hypothetical protein